jgi:16S rRNA processing protein RimM
VRTETTGRFVEIGVVGRPHGVGGEVRVFLHNPSSDIIPTLPTVFLKQSQELTEVTLLEFREGTKYHIVRFEGISTRYAAEALKGVSIWAARDDFPPVEDDEFYVADLVGLDAFVGNDCVGTIVSSRPQGGVEMVRVVNETDEVEIPLVEGYVDLLDISGGKVVFKDIETLPRSPVGRRSKR